jgi:hypothetical protein
LEANAAPRRISVEDARKLVYAVLNSQDSPHRIELYRMDNSSYDPDFFYFYAFGPNPAASPHLGNFAVNPWTGDVFDSDSCERLTSQSLKKLQQHIRKRSRLSGKEYSEASARKPSCGVG